MAKATSHCTKHNVVFSPKSDVLPAGTRCYIVYRAGGMLVPIARRRRDVNLGTPGSRTQHPGVGDICLQCPPGVIWLGGHCSGSFRKQRGPGRMDRISPTVPLRKKLAQVYFYLLLHACTHNMSAPLRKLCQSEYSTAVCTAQRAPDMVLRERFFSTGFFQRVSMRPTNTFEHHWPVAPVVEGVTT